MLNALRLELLHELVRQRRVRGRHDGFRLGDFHSVVGDTLAGLGSEADDVVDDVVVLTTQFDRQVVYEQGGDNRRVPLHDAINDVDHHQPHLGRGVAGSGDDAPGGPHQVGMRHPDAHYSGELVRCDGQAKQPEWVSEGLGLPEEYAIGDPLEGLDEVQQDLSVLGAFRCRQLGPCRLFPSCHR